MVFMDQGSRSKFKHFNEFYKLSIQKFIEVRCQLFELPFT